jgi:PAS domain S-box-containing protein
VTFDFYALLDAIAWEDTSLGCRLNWPCTLNAFLSLIARGKGPRYLVWGPDRRFFYNAAFLPIMGAKHPSGFGMPMADVWPGVWEDIEPLVTTTICDGVSQYLENIPFVLQRDGHDELTYFTFSFTPAVDDEDRVAGLFCALVERTRDVQARDQWRSELDHMQRLFKQAPGFVAVTQGPSHEFVLVNKAYERLVGHNEAELLGRTVEEVLPEVVDQGYAVMLDRAYSTGEPCVGRALPVRLARIPGSAEQQTLYIDFVQQPIQNDDGNVSGVFFQGADVTDRVHGEMTLRDAAARKDQFLAVLGHELRNPLSAIHTATAVLRLVGGGDHRTAKCLDVITRQTQQMSTLVEDLFDIARITTGLLTLKREEIDANVVAEDAIEQMRAKANDCQHQLRVISTNGPALVNGDAVRLTQMISNLLSNSIRYTPRGGEIKVSVTNTGSEVCVEVSDNGDGISAELMPNLFVPFAQENRSAERAGGLGIGLPLVKGIVDAHGGTIEVTSEGKGQGSRFSISLPACVPSSVPA